MFTKSGDFFVVKGYNSPDGLYEFSIWLKGKLVGSTFADANIDPLKILDDWLEWADENNVAH